MLQRTFVMTLLGSTLLAAQAEDLSTDKSQYNIFHPTPEKQMREWRTDQAGVSPYTLDAGHFEAEIEVVGYDTQDFNGGFDDGWNFSRYNETIDQWSYGTMTLKAGLLNCLDAEVTLSPYTTRTYTVVGESGNGYYYTRPFSIRRTDSGFGDISSRIKYNVWGNDGGLTALSLSGNVTYPTATGYIGSDRFSGGPSLEFAAFLPYGFELRLNNSVTFYEGYEDEPFFGNLISLGHQVVGPLYGYCLFDTRVSTDEYTDWDARVVPGLNYRVNSQFDVFIRSGFGVHGNTYDYSPSIGLNVRL